MTGKGGSRWRHNWIPLNWQAAMLKAHGSPKGAAKAAARAGVRKPAPAPKRPEPKRYYVVRSLGGRTFEIGDRQRGGVVRRTILDRREAEKIARQMNRG